MKHYFTISLVGAIALTIFLSNTPKQIHNPVRWEYKLLNTDVKPGQETEIVFYGTIEKDWYIYSTEFNIDNGPTKTTFEFKPDPNNTYIINGKVKAIKPLWKHDDVWGGVVKYFYNKAEFRQPVKILKTNCNIEGTISYQSCSDNNGRCVYSEQDFKIKASVAKVLKKTPSNITPTKSLALKNKATA